jgi:hypothetical protein
MLSYTAGQFPQSYVSNGVYFTLDDTGASLRQNGF